MREHTQRAQRAGSAPDTLPEARAARLASSVVLVLGGLGWLVLGGLAGGLVGAPRVGWLLAALLLPFGLWPAGRVLLDGELPGHPRAAVVLATALGVGRTPRAPGTAGTAAGLILVAGTTHLPVVAQAALAALLVGVGAVAAEVASRHHEQPDAPWIVVDEVAGMMVAMLGVPFSPVTALVGFALFRLADVGKPFPARWIDRSIPTGPGTMLDDVVAGLWVLAVMHGGLLVLG